MPHVAVFDTAFHATLPEEAATYALPARWRRELGHPPLRLPRALGAVGRRAGAGAAARRLPPRRRLLGHRRARRPLGRHDDGLHARSKGCRWRPAPARSTRGSLLYLLRHGHADVDELEHALEHESGLLGLSELSPHVHELEPPRRPATSGHGSRSTSTPAASPQAVAAAAVALGRPRRDRLHRRRRRALGASSARASARGSASSASSSTRRRTRRRAATARSQRPPPRFAWSSSSPREDLVIARAVRETLMATTASRPGSAV